MAFNEVFMKEAIKQAKYAMSMGEAPIGAVIVKNSEIISCGYNTRESENKISGHAEIMAIEGAEKVLGDWRLDGCDLYVTLEPCPMCAGAIIQSRIKNLYFGAFDKAAGACGSKLDLFIPQKFNHDTAVFGSVLEKECSSLLCTFFESVRKRTVR